MTRKLFFLLFLFSFSLLQVNAQNRYCVPGRFSTTPYFNYDSIRATRDVVYGYSKNPMTNTIDTLLMDFYYPRMDIDTMTKRPFILLVHGGSFQVGTRHDMDYLCIEFAMRGFVVGTIDYRMGWGCGSQLDACADCVADTDKLKNATYMCVQDVRAALRFAGSSAAGWNIDPDYFFIGGVSAGSIASFLAVTWNQSQANAFAPNAQNILGKLDTAGNAFPKKYTIRGIMDQCGAIAADSNLINNISVPLISFHDELDCVVPSGQGNLFGCACSNFYKCYGSEFVHDKMFANGGCTEINLVANSSSHCTFPAEQVMYRSSCFFKRVLCNECRSDTNTNIFSTPPCDSLGSTMEFGVDNFSAVVSTSPGNDLVELNFSEHSHHEGKIICYDNVGRKVFTQEFPYMTKQITIDTSKLPSGVYFLVFDYAEQISPKKMLVVHPQ